MTNKRRIALIGFCVFLGFMGICTLVAKGIYTSGLPRVTAKVPERKSISHSVEATGTVRQGQEYGVYVESGLRVGTVAVRNGDSFLQGDALFQIDPDDLKKIIENKELEIEKLKTQLTENSTSAQKEQQEQEVKLSRYREDYEQAVKDADLAISRKRQLLKEAEETLKEYEQYLTATAGSVSDGDTSLKESRQEKLVQLKQAVKEAGQAVEDAVLAKDKEVLAANRNIEDAANGGSSYSSAAQTNRLDIAYQQNLLKELKELLTRDGWVYAEEDGRIISQKLAVGERTPDSACLLYALDAGERMVEAVFTKEQSQYISLGDRMKLTTQLKSGSSINEEITVEYMDTDNEGQTVVQLLLDNPDVQIGQSAKISLTKQSETYETCIPADALKQTNTGSYYVYVAEESEGILGTEWRIRKQTVTLMDKNDSYAAIETAAISAESRIVISSTKEITDGTVVRMMD